MRSFAFSCSADDPCPNSRLSQARQAGNVHWQRVKVSSQVPLSCAEPNTALPDGNQLRPYANSWHQGGRGYRRQARQPLCSLLDCVQHSLEPGVKVHLGHSRLGRPLAWLAGRLRARLGCAVSCWLRATALSEPAEAHVYHL